MTRPPLLLALLLSAGLLTACDTEQRDANAAARATWDDRRPESYSFTYRIGGMAGLSRAEVTVRGGRVVEVSFLDKPEGSPGVTDPPTVDGVFDLVDDAIDEVDHEDGVSVDYDEVWGFPATVAVDPVADGADDEYGFGIDDFRVLES